MCSLIRIVPFLALAFFAGTIAAQDAEISESPEYLFVYTKSDGSIDIAWALPRVAADKPDNIPGLWLDSDGKKVYAIPRNCGFFVDHYSIEQLAKSETLVGLDLSALMITDSDLHLLAQSRSLRDLVLDHSSVTDKGLTHLRRLATLRALSLFRTKVKAAAIRNFEAENPRVDIHMTGEFQWSSANRAGKAVKLPRFPTPLRLD